MIGRTQLRADYSISSIIKGGWHLAGGHGQVNTEQAIKDMYRFAKAGITTFDCADIYTGVEALIGQFIKKYKIKAEADLPEIQIHTKYVPDYDKLSSLRKSDTEKIIDRSLQRLGVDQLDLVQFAWWDYKIPGHIEVCQHLKELQKTGKIKYIGVTNCDAKHLQELLDADIEIVTNQVQYSLLDRRPENKLLPLCIQNNIQLLCYGVVAGGFLSDKYFGAPDPTPPLENRSLTKYRLIIDEFGGYDKFQQLLKLLDQIAKKHSVGIAEIAIKYIIDKKHIAATIIGARNDHHLQKLIAISQIDLDEVDCNILDEFLQTTDGPAGIVYALERDKEGKHGRIMRYNLNESD